MAGEPVPFDGRLINFREPEGYDARLKTCFFDRDRVLPTNPAAGCDTPSRYRVRPARGLGAVVEKSVEDEGWNRESLRERVTQFVVHYDVCTTSKRCFEVLHDVRGLSVHFLLDIDGTLYQTLDLMHRARHAGIANDASIGIEIAHIGAYLPGDDTWKSYYGPPDSEGRRKVQPPARFGPPPGEYYTARGGVFKTAIHGRGVRDAGLHRSPVPQP